MLISITKHIEMGKICFCFSENFNINDIHPDIIIKMFENINNRIL